MRTRSLILALFFYGALLQAQHTFSIVALDTLTGEIGSAGASCLDNLQFPGSGGAIIISDLLPGKGAIHSQAQWNSTNQQNARLKMQEGLSPEEILLWLKTHDTGGIIGSYSRQYGIVDFDSMGHPRSAGFTGNSCLQWRGHKLGANYAIQGNILLGPQILDSMEARFLSSSGPLADRLMAALQGANVVGADTRCTSNGTSSLSAFLRVAKPGDTTGVLYLDLNVPVVPAGMEPIDSLQRRYNNWKLTGVLEPIVAQVNIYPNPAISSVVVEFEGRLGTVDFISPQGQLLSSLRLQQGQNMLSPTLPQGLVFVRVRADGVPVTTRKIWWGN
jgi:uncharacterized Ntn-hydrolase superfamily protein